MPGEVTATPYQGTPLAALTVAVALRETPLREASLVAGAHGVDRPIESVGVLDLAELDALRRGQLVFSTAHTLRTCDLAALVGRLAAAGVSGFGVKPDGDWPRLPDELVAVCEAHALPLLAVPPGRFDAIITPVLAAIADRQIERLNRMAELHDALTRAALGNEPMPAIAATVARVLGGPVAVLDEHGSVVAATGEPELWEPPAVAQRAAEADATGVALIDGRRYLVASIATLGRRYGAVCATGVMCDDGFAHAALLQAAVVCGMQLVGRQRVDAVHRRFERQLLEELAEGRLTADEIRERAERLRWPQHAPYAILLVAARRPSRSGPLAAADFTLSAESAVAVGRALAAGTLPVRTFTHRRCLGVVAHLLDGRDVGGAAEGLWRRLAADGAASLPGQALAMGVSRPRLAVTELPAASREAALALLTSPRVRAGERHIEHFDDLGAERLLAQITDLDRLATMALEALGPLGDPDLPGRNELLTTLAALLAHNMRLADAVGDLYFHYNTVRHRLARLRSLLGPQLERPEERLALALALTALRVVAVERPELAPPVFSGEPSAARTRPRSARAGSLPRR